MISSNSHSTHLQFGCKCCDNTKFALKHGIAAFKTITCTCT